MVILPAIDLWQGRCVRLRQGDYSQRTEYSADPIEVARGYRDAGAEWVHIVDLEGAKAGEPTGNHLRILERISAETGLSVQFGGGIKSRSSVEAVLAAGASRFVLGSALVRDPDLAEWCFLNHPERAVGGIDSRDGRVAVQGWTEDSGRPAEEVAGFAAEKGARLLVVTDIATDGMLSGPNLSLLRRVHEASGLPVIASGGVSDLRDLEALAALGSFVAGVIVGKALYEGRIELSETLARFR